MNRILVTAALVWACVSFASVQDGLAREKRLSVIRTVVIDPGHGGDNNGALAFNGVYEKEIVMAIGLDVKEILEKKSDVEVHLTRDGDKTVPLGRRIEMANELQADIFISLHCNSSFSTKPSGIETYVLSDEALDEESGKLSRRVVQPKGLYASAADPAAAAVVKEMLQFAAHRDAKGFADVVQRVMAKRTKSIDRGVKSLPIVVLRGAEMPGVVIEVGFVSNPVEAENLDRSGYRRRIAESIADAIIHYDAILSKKRSPGKVAGDNPVVGSN